MCLQTELSTELYEAKNLSLICLYEHWVIEIEIYFDSALNLIIIAFKQFREKSIFNEV